MTSVMDVQAQNEIVSNISNFLESNFLIIKKWLLYVFIKIIITPIYKIIITQNDLHKLPIVTCQLPIKLPTYYNKVKIK